MLTGDVELAVDEGIAWVSFNRPAAMNAMSPGWLAGLETALTQVESRDDVRVVIFIGVGKAFCAGGDLKYFKSLVDAGAHQDLGAFAAAVAAALRRIEQLPVPTIAAVNGVAVAGGFELILCCDLVVAAATAKIGDGHAQFGMIPGSGGSVRLPRRLPPVLAKQMLFGGELYDAEKLHQWGLINKVVAADMLRSTAIDLAKTLTEHSPLGIKLMKELAGASTELSSEDAFSMEHRFFRRYVASEDVKEGLNAFAERRPPVFRGV